MLFITILLIGGWKARHDVPEETLFSWAKHGIKWEWEAKEEEEKEHAIDDVEVGITHAIYY